MSGTSVDGIDAALVEISGHELELQVTCLDKAVFPYEPSLKRGIIAAIQGDSLSLDSLSALDEAIAEAFAQAALSLASSTENVSVIGSHGQTVYHRPPTLEKLGYSLQLGRGATIAYLTKIPTVSDFRSADIAAGGQGAPLVPKVDAALLADSHRVRCVQNIGGMANVTYLPSRKQPDWETQIRGWDTGPGNILLDLAVTELTQGKQNYDQGGNWAAQGQPCLPLVDKWLKETKFYRQSPPKSTGRELFNLDYLAKCRADAIQLNLTTADWLATLTQLTATTIVENYQRFLPQMPTEVLLSGGGSRNLYLKSLIQAKLGEAVAVVTTDDLGIDGKFKEAIAFAVLAYWRFQDNFPGNLPQVTGASQATLLGSINYPAGVKLAEQGERF